MNDSNLATAEPSHPSRSGLDIGPPEVPCIPGFRTERAEGTGSRVTELLRWAFSFPAMLGVFLVGAVFVSARMFVVDPDVWWHIKVGQDLLVTHNWPTTDPYSFTVAGQPWIAYEWLGDVIWALVYRLGGLQGMDALLILLGGVVMVALYYYATLRSGNSKAGFVAAAVLLPLAGVSFTLRPQMIGYVFLLLTLILMERFRQGMQRGVWFLPVLFLLWVNAHGTFIFGLGVVFVYWAAGWKDFRFGGIEARAWSAAERIRLGSVFLLCLSVLPLTPYGTRLAVYPFDMAFAQPINVAHIAEWQPMPVALLPGKIFLGLVALFIVLQVAYQLTWRVAELALCLFGTLMACLHARFLLLFVPFFVPWFAVTLAQWVPSYERSKDRFLLNGILTAAVVTAMIVYFPSRASFEQLAAKTYPVGSVEYLRSNPTIGPTYDSYGFGGYLVYSGQRVFIDGRGDVYERGGVLGDYLHISHLQPGTLAVLSSYGIRSCLVAPDEPLATLLAASQNWRRVFADNVSAIYVNTTLEPPKSNE